MMKVLLKDACSIIMGQSPDSKSYNNQGDGLPFYQGNADFGDVHPITRVWCASPIRIAKEGDILISVRAPIGAMNIATTRCCIGRGLAALRPNEADFDNQFLFYVLQSMVDRLIEQGTGSTFKAIGKSILENTELPYYSLAEQAKIVSELNKLGKAIVIKKTQLALLDEVVKSRFVEMFGESGKEESTYRLGSLCSVGSSKRVYQEELLHDGIPFLRISDLNCLIDNTSFEQESFISYQKYNQLAKEKMVPSKGDLLITSRGTLGRCYVICPDDNFYFQDGMISWLHDFASNVRAEYIAFLFQNGLFDDQIANMQLGATVSYLSIKMLKSLMVKVPSLVMQDEFLDFLHQVDKSKLVIKKSLSALEELKGSLMQKYFFD